MYDLITIGDSTIDHYFKIHNAHTSCNLNRTSCQLNLDYGSKIPVDSYNQIVAGNNANVAVGTSRSGLKVATYTNVGGDDGGSSIIKILKKEGIDTKYIKINPSLSSNVSAIINFQGERTILVYHQPWQYDLPDFDKTSWVYLTSLSASFAESNLIAQLVSFLERTRAKLIFGPGTYQLKAGVKKYPQLLSLMKALIVNLEEAKIILEEDEDKKIAVKKLLEKLHDLGPEIIIITDGDKGSYGFDGNNYYHLGVFPAELIEMTGAGDAYCSGLIAGLNHHQDLSEAMRWGTANSASVIKQIGPQEGLLSYDKMQSILQENSKIIAIKI